MSDSEPLVSFHYTNSIFKLNLPLILTTHLLTVMPPKKTLTAKKGTEAKGWTSPRIIELPPSDPPSPGSSNLGEGSYYEAPTGDLAAALTLLAQSLSALKKTSK